jgi:hypothetical protein
MSSLRAGAFRADRVLLPIPDSGRWTELGRLCDDLAAAPRTHEPTASARKLSLRISSENAADMPPLSLPPIFGDATTFARINSNHQNRTISSLIYWIEQAKIPCCSAIARRRGRALHYIISLGFAGSDVTRGNRATNINIQNR